MRTNNPLMNRLNNGGPCVASLSKVEKGDVFRMEKNSDGSRNWDKAGELRKGASCSKGSFHREGREVEVGERI